MYVCLFGCEHLSTQYINVIDQKMLCLYVVLMCYLLFEQAQFAYVYLCVCIQNYIFPHVSALINIVYET